nr:hypothetical protein [Tanacetum cinerariifolium]
KRLIVEDVVIDSRNENVFDDNNSMENGGEEGLCFLKFRSEEGLNFVIDQSSWMEVRNMRDKYVENRRNNVGNKNGYPRSWNTSTYVNSKYMFRPKMPNIVVDKEKQNDNGKQKGKDVIDRNPPSLEKVWNIESSKIKELREVQIIMMY